MAADDSVVILTPTPLQMLERGAHSHQRCPQYGNYPSPWFELLTEHRSAPLQHLERGAVRRGEDLELTPLTPSLDDPRSQFALIAARAEPPCPYHRDSSSASSWRPFHPLGENPTLALERDLELIQWLDYLGYDEAWVGEHHSAGWETIGSPEVFLAVAAERTKHIKLGSGVVSLPYHNPYMVAERAVLLDHLTRGRFMLGLGPGALPSDAKQLGIDRWTASALAWRKASASSSAC